jgi:hypothetical protein
MPENEKRAGVSPPARKKTIGLLAMRLENRLDGTAHFTAAWKHFSAKFQLTTFQKPSTYFGRSLR